MKNTAPTIDTRLASIEQRLDALEAQATTNTAQPSDALPTTRAELEQALDDARVRLDEAIQLHARAHARFLTYGDNGDEVRTAYALRVDAEALENRIADRLELFER